MMIGHWEHGQKVVTDGRLFRKWPSGYAYQERRTLWNLQKKFFLVVLDRVFLLSFRDGVLVWGENSVFLLVTYTCK